MGRPAEKGCPTACLGAFFPVVYSYFFHPAFPLAGFPDKPQSHAVAWQSPALRTYIWL